jgi:hypothetical protein
MAGKGNLLGTCRVDAGGHSSATPVVARVEEV